MILETLLTGVGAAALVSALTEILNRWKNSKNAESIELKIDGKKVSLDLKNKSEIRKIISELNTVRVFLSYSHGDQSFAQKLAHDLKNQGVEVWLDSEKIDVGDDLVKKIDEGIKNSAYFILILSENYLQSKWVTKEINIMERLEQTDSISKIIPILIDNSALPSNLENRAFADFRNDYNSGLEKVLAKLKPNVANKR